ncbi:MAG: NUDIX hydrolase [Caldilineaceae bacterium]|nr:NUDIX hydrolase [Caldilineaceae bacterium]
MNFAQFDDPSALQRWLHARGIDTTNWGQGAAKTVDALWHELAAGEAQLQDDPPLRKIAVVKLIIRRGEMVLHEVEQELADGRRRPRNHAPGEKLLPGETVTAAALRGLHEEVGLAPAEVRIVSLEPPTFRELESPSYPGLRTHYTFYAVVVAAAGLPAHTFWTEETARQANEPVARHRWEWVKVQEDCHAK